VSGIRWRAIREQPVSHIISCNAETAFNGDRLAHVSSRAPGIVQQVIKRAGDRVAAGETLALIDSVELAGAKAALLQANTLVQMWTGTLERLKPLAEKGLVAQKEIIQAETSMAEARIDLAQATQRLRNLGMEQAAIEQVLAGDDAHPALKVVAPFDGVIIERHAVLGESIDAQHVLFTIADTSTMWVMLDVRETDLRHVRLGQTVTVSVSALADETFAGEIAWVAAAVDPTTRTLKVRADLPNLEGMLRANMFGKAHIIASEKAPRLIVPREAVQWDGCCNLVFVRQTDTVFQPFKVRLGADLGTHYAVEDGLRSGDEIVTDGAFLLKTELLRDSIGAGCCEPGGVKTE
jgi:cobalt-zinc-cadmium efflux system membrane fusion protein